MLLDSLDFSVLCLCFCLSLGVILPFDSMEKQYVYLWDSKVLTVLSPFSAEIAMITIALVDLDFCRQEKRPRMRLIPVQLVTL